jgi:hypothetical protein
MRVPRVPDLSADGRGLPSLPLGVDPKMGPSFPFCHESCANGILKDIVSDFAYLLVMAQAMVEKIALPLDANISSGPMFPRPDGRRHFLGKRCKKMQMVRHD